MSIIYDFTGKEHTLNGCLGCEIINKLLTPPAGIIYQNKHFTVMQDFELPIDGFIIISSNKHIEQLSELTEDERLDLMNIINKTLNILKEHAVAKEYNIILEEKQSYHFHVWLMPRHKWMIEKFGKVLKNLAAIQKYALENLKTPENINKIVKTCEVLKNELNK